MILARGRNSLNASDHDAFNPPQEVAMDPDANLARQRAIFAELTTLDAHGMFDGGTRQARTNELLLELWSLTESLDGWLRKGGALPREWCGSRTCPACGFAS